MGKEEDTCDCVIGYLVVEGLAMELEEGGVWLDRVAPPGMGWREEGGQMKGKIGGEGREGEREGEGERREGLERSSSTDAYIGVPIDLVGN